MKDEKRDNNTTCPNCGRACAPDAHLCPNCGQRMDNRPSPDAGDIDIQALYAQIPNLDKEKAKLRQISAEAAANTEKSNQYSKRLDELSKKMEEIRRILVSEKDKAQGEDIDDETFERLSSMFNEYDAEIHDNLDKLRKCVIEAKRLAAEMDKLRADIDTREAEMKAAEAAIKQAKRRIGT